MLSIEKLLGHIPSHLFQAEVNVTNKDISDVLASLPDVGENETVVLERIKHRARELFTLHKKTDGGDIVAISLFWLMVKEELTIKLPADKTLEVRNNGSIVMIDV